MQRDALEFLQDTIQAASEQHRIDSHAIPAALIMPSNQQLKDMEPFHDHRRRFRGTYSTSVIDSFCSYVRANTGTSRPGVFVDADNTTATAIFNLGDRAAPGHADYTAALILKQTAAYTALQQFLRQSHEQRTVLDFLEDWAALIPGGATENAEPITPAQILLGVRNITVKAKAERGHIEGDFKSARTALDDVEARAGDHTPAVVRFRTATHHGLAERELTLRLSILTGDEKPRLRLRLVGADALPEQIADEFKGLLTQSLGEHADISIGTFKA